MILRGFPAKIKVRQVHVDFSPFWQIRDITRYNLFDEDDLREFPAKIKVQQVDFGPFWQIGIITRYNLFDEDDFKGISSKDKSTVGTFWSFLADWNNYSLHSI